ncbi:flagellar biosynthetic protein FliR [Tautonia plasticadhaerens]|uniref:Flagellar biosynthesis protein FliR n=1 Tax=Tautonia plasticadhaerens TaxID=2527974 RepID=A0A518HCU3_9BACT|nr:flagellar biosynthetic protein FliR [Tautonia plasticadhaerens]QDV38684.1 flagellar biosynthesis protein FliR [Tautonia plasticadhaerens]
MPPPPFDLLGSPAAFLLVLSRSVGLVWALAWLAGGAGAGLRVRLAASAVIAAAVSPLVGDDVPTSSDPLALGGLALYEAMAGAVLGIGAGLIAAAARLAGEVIGAQAGLSAAASIAPGPGAEDGPEPPLATLGGLVALATFAALDGPFRLMIALAGSYRIGPAGGVGVVGVTGEASLRSAFAMVSQAIGLALRLAAPIALALLVAQVAVGLLARSAPALSSFSAWLPVRLGIGLLLTLLGVAGMASALASAWSATLPAG